MESLKELAMDHAQVPDRYRDLVGISLRGDTHKELVAEAERLAVYFSEHAG